MTTRTDYHTNTADEFLAKAHGYLADGDLLQASEKGWGAAAQMVQAVAESHGWRHQTHRDLFQTLNHLAEGQANKELHRLFHSANALHQNFYEGLMPPEAVEAGLDAVEQLVDRLRSYLP